jgi:hypothetical protein
MPTLQKIELVSVGPWNPRIFTPVWIGSLLKEYFPDLQPNELAAEVNFDDLVISFVFRKLTIRPTYQNLVFEIDDVSPDFVQRTTSFSKSIFQKLGNTPIKGVGVNFTFMIDSTDLRLNEVFESESKLGHGFVPTAFRIPKGNQKYVTNLLKENNPAGKYLKVNFHYEINDFAPRFEADSLKMIDDHKKEAEGLIS